MRRYALPLQLDTGYPIAGALNIGHSGRNGHLQLVAAAFKQKLHSLGMAPNRGIHAAGVPQGIGSIENLILGRR